MPQNKLKTNLLYYVYDIYKDLESYEKIFSYEGEISHKTIITFTSLTERKLLERKESEYIQKRVYHVMVECLQNVCKHASCQGSESNSERLPKEGIIAVYHDNNSYYVITGNYIEKSRAEDLERFLNKINKMSVDKLNKLFKDRLISGHISDKGGAGLGLIDIRRKIDSELIYHFIPVSGNLEFFILNVVVFKKN